MATKHIKKQPSKADYLTLIQKSPEGLLVIDEAGLILFLNPAAEVILGLHSAEILGKPIGFPINSDQNIEIKILLPDLQEKIIATRIAKLTWQNQPAYLVSLSDITAIKKIDQLKSEIIKRRHAYQIKEAFVRTVAHDLRTPLAVVKEAAESLKDGIEGALSEDQAFMADIASRNADRMANIINQLRNLSNLESSKPAVHIMPLDLNLLIQKTLQTLEKESRTTNLIYQPELPGFLPIVYAEEALFTQVLTDLLKSAPKFASKKIVLRAKVAQQPDPLVLDNRLHPRSSAIFKTHGSDINGFIEMSVICDGEHQFPFNRSEIIKKSAQMSSLEELSDAEESFGFSLIKDLIERHDGKIWVDQDDHSSVQFHFILPVYHAGLSH